ncbi:MAG: DUF481 domain-containing protein [Planctomycetota bacterium]
MLIILLIVIFAPPGHGDTAVFTSGERLQGRLVALREGSVAFESDVAGRVSVARHKVQQLSAEPGDRTWELTVAGGEVYRGKVRRLTDGELVFEPAGQEAVRMELSRVQRLLSERTGDEQQEGGRIYLENGDRITGEVSQLKDISVTGNVEGGGSLTVPLSRVRTFGTTDPVDIYLASGESTEARVSAAGRGRVRVESGVVPGGQVVKLSELTAINFQPDKKPEWKGSVSGGYTANRGNTRSQSTSLKMRLRKRWESSRAKLRTHYLKSAQENPDSNERIVTEDELTARGQYDYFFTDTRYTYGAVRYRTDEVANLDTRLNMSAGGGYQWVETESLMFNTEAGLGVKREAYSDPSRSSSEGSAEVTYELETALNDRLTFMHDLTVAPSIGQWSDYYITSGAELRVSLTDMVYSSVELALEYESDPAAGTPKTDTTYILGGGVEF